MFFVGNSVHRALKCWLLSVLLCSTSLVLAATPDIEEIWRMVQMQSQKIEQLENQLTESQNRLAEAQQRLNTATDAHAISIENQSVIAATRQELEATIESVELAMQEDNTANRNTTLGGYGELHYNNLDKGSAIDFHRYVLFLNHQFADNLNFYSELEVEHSIAGEGKVGEVELEQAFIQWDYNQSHNFKFGLFLIPLGILNETHEPDTFYGVERNTVEKNIIPATWWEGGFGFNGELAPGWGYDLAFHSGLNLDADNASASKRSSIRSARQKVGKANAENFAATARVSFSGYPGLRVSAAFQRQSDLTQDDDDDVGVSGIGANLYEFDVQFQRNMFAFRALYAKWDIDSGINQLNEGADEQVGWYLEPSVKLNPKLGFFARYGSYDLLASNSASASEKKQFDIGLNYWIHPRVVVKMDYQQQDNENGTDNDGFNIGMGYSF